MNLGKEYEQSVLLRGIAWNGVSAPLVRFVDSCRKNDGDLQGSTELKVGGDTRIPGLVYIEGIGTYAFGSDPDQLERNAKGAEERVDLPSVRGRADTVRGKVCVVTGGAQGFGKEIVLNLISDGAVVFIADLNYQGACKLASQLNAETGETRAFPVEINVADETSVESMVVEIVKTVGGIDLFVSNAGILKAGSVEEISHEDFSFITSVNYIGYFLCAKYASQVMAIQHK